MTFIALLRAVNLGSHNRVSMAALRELAARLDLGNPRTLVQSGNLVFEAAARSAARLEAQLEQATAEHLGVTTDYMVRSADEWREVVDRNPFSEAAAEAPNLAYVIAMKTPPDPEAARAFAGSHTGPEQLHVDGRHVYVVYHRGMGQSRLTGALIERRLARRGTARNWNTVRRLAELAAAGSG
jgi:uncharacterized protein (DUF1697 family)